MSLKGKKKRGETDYHGNSSDVVQDGGIISDIYQKHRLVSRESHYALLGKCVYSSGGVFKSLVIIVNL